MYAIGDYADSKYAEYHVDIIQNMEEEFLDEGNTCLYGLVKSSFQRIEYNDNLYKNYRYIFNCNTNEYVDMEHCPLDPGLGVFKDHGKWYITTIAPPPLLLALGNGLGSGDYCANNNPLVGSWAKDTCNLEISNIMLYPNYKEFTPEFYKDKKIPYQEKEKIIKFAKLHSKDVRSK